MKRRLVWSALGVLAFVGMGIWAQEPAGKKEPMTFSLECAGGDCPLLKGRATDGGDARRVSAVEARRECGLALDRQNEEALVILRGSGVANIEGHADVPVSAHRMAYIPPETKHNVTNTGAEVLEYVWVAAPIAPGR